ncbi:serine/threonine-protein kinase [Streptomyces sp. ID05-04B]|uniref:serine/threonine-protein kinase n=1 Tax=unclassified Streptomyces TaxID=2593676 RepID=UPI00131EE5EF|nr:MULTISPECIES: serine/threonine-protein kinase [unclassified Streptomyces]MDX5565825.1 serine/threonine-protein kinase [Streptomyces sp. ID05-04B]
MREGQVLGGRYVLERLVERGGMGEVWRGHDPDLDRTVAVKALPLDRIELRGGTETAAKTRRLRIDFFEREARAMARIDSPRVAVVHDLGREGDVLFLVMEFIDGISLAGVIGEGVQLTLEQVVRWTVQICEGLAAAHGCGVIHRDVKPANIMITKDGDAKVVDFGIARFQDATRSRSGFGTLLYTAPERFDREGEETYRVDLYSLGCVLHEMLTLKPPFGRADSSDAYLVHQHLHRPPPPPSESRAGISPDLDRLVLRLLDKVPTRRPESAEEVARTIERVILHDPRAVVRADVVRDSGGGRPHVNTAYVEQIRRNERRIRELHEWEDWMSDVVLEARAQQAELTGESGDARGAAALYQSLGDDCARGLGWEHARVKLAYVAAARWTDLIDDEPEL